MEQIAMTMGRPTKYTPELASRICEVIATSRKSIANICDSYDEFPDEANVFLWMHKYPSFREEYLAAKETQAIMLTEGLLAAAIECPAISEEIQKQTHIFRVTQWHNSKLAPKQFGEKKETKQQITLNVHESDLAHLK